MFCNGTYEEFPLLLFALLLLFVFVGLVGDVPVSVVIGTTDWELPFVPDTKGVGSYVGITNWLVWAFTKSKGKNKLTNMVKIVRRTKTFMKLIVAYYNPIYIFSRTILVSKNIFE